MKEIPVVNVAVSTYSIADKYQYAKMKKNANALLQHLEEGDLDKVESFLAGISHDQQKTDDFCETLMDIILYSPRVLKSRLLAGLLSAAGRGDLTYQEYDQISLILSQASVPSLKALTAFFEETEA